MYTCKFCKKPTDTGRYYQKQYPTVLIGPWCSDCISRVKVCSQCQEDYLVSESTNVSNGVWLCRRCYETYRIQKEF